MLRFSTLLSLVGLLSCLALSSNSLLAQEKAEGVKMIVAEGEGAKYWPGWRGPTRQGLVLSGQYPDKWSPKQNVIWKVEVPGNGNSSPVVWGDKIFLTSAIGGANKRAVLCFRRSDGKLLWTGKVPQGADEKAYWKNGFASGTPATDGKHVYAYFGNRGLVCFDFDGKIVWHHELKAMNALHGMACSPLLYKDKVIIFQEARGARRAPRGKKAGFILALDKKTGKTIWKTPRKERVGWGSPIAIGVDGRDQIVVSSSFSVYGYDPQDGSFIWNCKGNTVEVIPTPVVGHGLVYCCSGRRGPTLAIDPSGKGNVTNSHIKWSVKTDSPFVPSPLLYKGYLYSVNDILGEIRCFDAKTGEKMWEKRFPVDAAKHGFSASPIGVNGKVYFISDKGNVYVFKAGPKYNLLHVNQLGEKTLATPALVDGRWYVRTRQHLYCFGVEKS